MKIGITGHRPDNLKNDYKLITPTVLAIKKVIEDIINPYLFISKNRFDRLELITGMALGIDTLFAKIAIEKNIPFVAAVPFKGQDLMWRDESKNLYIDLLKRADEIFIVDEDRYADYKEFINYDKSKIKYSANKLQKRNIWLVDHCDILIAVWNGNTGGTKNCINYAKSIRKTIVYINPNNFVLKR